MDKRYVSNFNQSQVVLIMWLNMENAERVNKKVTPFNGKDAVFIVEQKIKLNVINQAKTYRKQAYLLIGVINYNLIIYFKIFRKC